MTILDPSRQGSPEPPATTETDHPTPERNPAAPEPVHALLQGLKAQLGTLSDVEVAAQVAPPVVAAFAAKSLRAVAALEAILKRMEDRAVTLQGTAERLHLQVMDHAPDRDVDAANRYQNYAAEAASAFTDIQKTVASALHGKPVRQ